MGEVLPPFVKIGYAFHGAVPQFVVSDVSALGTCSSSQYDAIESWEMVIYSILLLQYMSPAILLRIQCMIYFYVEQSKDDCLRVESIYQLVTSNDPDHLYLHLSAVDHVLCWLVVKSYQTCRKWSGLQGIFCVWCLSRCF